MKHKNLLFVCEGNDDEKLLQAILKTYKIDVNFEIYKYKTNIHLFAKHLFQNYAFHCDEIKIEDIDVIQMLKEFRYEEVLEKKFTDILFVFDFDPQDPRFQPEVLMKLITIFSESTNQGQLFINYPMVEAALDFRSFPDPEYNYKVCKLEDIRFKGYKNFVKKNSAIKNFNDISESNLRTILKQTYEKMMYLTKGESCDYVLLLELQNEMLQTFKTISIISSSLLFIRDYNIKKFSNYINENFLDL